MAEIVNLRTARKRQARADASVQAEANRLKHGRSKAEKTRSEAATVAAERHLDRHRLRSVSDRPKRDAD